MFGWPLSAASGATAAELAPPSATACSRATACVGLWCRIRLRTVAWIKRTLSTCATPPPDGEVSPPFIITGKIMAAVLRMR